MTHLHKLRILKWVSSSFVNCPRIPLWAMDSLSDVANHSRFYGTRPIVRTKQKLGGNDDNNHKTGFISSEIRREAQDALLDYLHFTRKYEYRDAEHVSRNSPLFLQKLLEEVDTEEDVGRSIEQFLCYHPINEFEPFYESLGLKPNECNAIVPRHLTFLSDDCLLVENYYVLWNYGVERGKIGKICMEAAEVFRYSYGVLAPKLKAYQDLGLSQSFVTKLVVCSPYLLIGDVNEDFVKVLQVLRKWQIEFSWIEQQLSEEYSYNWSQILALLNFFRSLGYSDEQLGVLIRLQPEFLFDGSGEFLLLLVGLLLKLGSTMKQIHSVFHEFPQIPVKIFVSNLRRCIQSLSEIDMEVSEIGNIIRSHTVLVGSCTLKKANSLLFSLKAGKKQICKFIQENPKELKNLVVGLKVAPLPDKGEKLRAKMKKTKFLISLGFAGKSGELERALRLFIGNGSDLQERFDFIVDAGIDRQDVSKMIKVAPQILNLSKDVIKMKINFLVNDLGYPISSVVAFPQYFNYTEKRVMLRLSMYSWLKDQGAVSRTLFWSTLITCTEAVYINRYVRHHPRGLQVWEDLKRRIYDE